LAPHDRRIADAVSRHASRGRRVVLLARSEDALATDRLPSQRHPVALVVLGDRIREDAADTLRFFARQGVTAKVISGDHPDTVAAVAREVGVPGSLNVVDAGSLPEDPDELADVVEQTNVFGRVQPHQKRKMVAALQSRGHVVAMTGDGVNDVLALKDSDIGIAMGSGSSASRAVAQLVLIDGSFATIPGVVGEGRRVIANIERVANLFVTKTVYAVFLALAIGVVGRPFPFLPRHLTLVGSVTIGIPAFFLALAPNTRRAKPGFIKRVLRFSVPTGLAAGLATFAAYELAIAEDVSLQEARTTATLVLAAIGLIALGMVSRPLIAWKKGLLWAMGGLLLVLLVSDASQSFFELDIPRPVVLMAAVGVVAVTGGAMVGTLRSVGWLSRMPDYLREYPPQDGRTWQELRQRFEKLIGWEERPADALPAETPSAESPATETPPAETPPAETPPTQARPAGTAAPGGGQDDTTRRGPRVPTPPVAAPRVVPPPQPEADPVRWLEPDDVLDAGLEALEQDFLTDEELLDTDDDPFAGIEFFDPENQGE
jgi:cation-transporting ATPase E